MSAPHLLSFHRGRTHDGWAFFASTAAAGVAHGQFTLEAPQHASGVETLSLSGAGGGSLTLGPIEAATAGPGSRAMAQAPGPASGQPEGETALPAVSIGGSLTRPSGDSWNTGFVGDQRSGELAHQYQIIKDTPGIASAAPITASALAGIIVLAALAFAAGRRRRKSHRKRSRSRRAPEGPIW